MAPTGCEEQVVAVAFNPKEVPTVDPFAGLLTVTPFEVVGVEVVEVLCVVTVRGTSETQDAP